MNLNKKGISLIVLVITVIVLAILAATVIINLSNSNIISEANKAVSNYNTQQYEAKLNLAYASWIIDNPNTKLNDISELEEYGFDSSSMPNDYMAIIYNGAPKIASVVVASEVQVGDKVMYTPDAAPTMEYAGSTYVYNEDEWSAEKVEKIYKPGTLEWVYLGQDESGNALLTSKTATDFTIGIAGYDGYQNRSK